MTQGLNRRRGALAALPLIGLLAMAPPAHAAYDIQAPLSCAIPALIELTNSSNFRIPKGANVTIVISSGTLRQTVSRQLNAALPIGAKTGIGPVLLATQPGASTTCTATAVWRTFRDVYVKP